MTLPRPCLTDNVLWFRSRAVSILSYFFFFSLILIRSRFWNILFLSKERICNHARQVSSVVSWTFWCVSLSFSLIGLLFSFSLTRPPPSIGLASLWTSSWDFHWTITKCKFKILNQLQIFYYVYLSWNNEASPSPLMLTNTATHSRAKKISHTEMPKNTNSL